MASSTCKFIVNPSRPPEGWSGRVTKSSHDYWLGRVRLKEHQRYLAETASFPEAVDRKSFLRLTGVRCDTRGVSASIGVMLRFANEGIGDGAQVRFAQLLFSPSRSYSSSTLKHFASLIARIGSLAQIFSSVCWLIPVEWIRAVLLLSAL